MRKALLIAAVVLSTLPGLASAGSISFTQRIVADFEFSLTANSPIHAGPATPFIPFRAIGSLTFSVDDSINDPGMPATVAITGLSGVLDGVSPAEFLPYTISPNVQFVGGSLTNIVRDGGGHLTSAEVTGLSAYWELIGPGGLRLFGDAPLEFNGHIGSIPFGDGTLLAGPDEFNVFMDTGNGTGPLVAIGRNRTLTAVPEPSTLASVALGALAVVGYSRRKRTAK